MNDVKGLNWQFIEMLLGLHEKNSKDDSDDKSDSSDSDVEYGEETEVLSNNEALILLENNEKILKKYQK